MQMPFAPFGFRVAQRLEKEQRAKMDQVRRGAFKNRLTERMCDNCGKVLIMTAAQLKAHSAGCRLTEQ